MSTLAQRSCLELREQVNVNYLEIMILLPSLLNLPEFSVWVREEALEILPNVGADFRRGMKDIAHPPPYLPTPTL